MFFTHLELIAITRMALYISGADGSHHQKETNAITSELRRFGVGQEECTSVITRALIISFDEAAQTISNFNMEEKRYVTAFLGVLIMVDENIAPAEMDMWRKISNRCNLPAMTLHDALEIMLSLSR